MSKTIPSNPRQPITYFGIAYVLTQTDNDHLHNVDSNLNKLLKGKLYLAPDGSRHITILNLTAVAEHANDRETLGYFETNRDLIQQTLERVAHTSSPFAITFNKLEAHNRAVILRGQDNGEVARLRDQLKSIPQLKARNIEPGFIHSTEARYQSALELDKVRELVASLSINVSILIDKIQLVQVGQGFGSSEVIAEYKLVGKSKAEQ